MACQQIPKIHASWASVLSDAVFGPDSSCCIGVKAHVSNITTCLCRKQKVVEQEEEEEVEDADLQDSGDSDDDDVHNDSTDLGKTASQDRRLRPRKGVSFNLEEMSASPEASAEAAEEVDSEAEPSSAPSSKGSGKRKRAESVKIVDQEDSGPAQLVEMRPVSSSRHLASTPVTSMQRRTDNHE